MVAQLWQKGAGCALHRLAPQRAIACYFIFLFIYINHVKITHQSGWFRSGFHQTVFATMSKNTVNRIVSAGREAMIQGLSVPSTARLLRQKGIEGGAQALESLARTYMLSASNYANEQVFERNKDIVPRLQYSAVLDGRTCIVCGNDDGKIFKIDGLRPRLPRHINCRCLYIPLPDWEQIGLPELSQNNRQRPAVKHSERTVHHKDGTTSTRFKVADVEHAGDYSAWITRQLKEDSEFVCRVLGKTRFELFVSGQLTLNKMIVDGRIRRL